MTDYTITITKTGKAYSAIAANPVAALDKIRHDLKRDIEAGAADGKKVNGISFDFCADGANTITHSKGSDRFNILIKWYAPNVGSAPRTIGNGPITPKQIALIKRLGGEYHANMSKRDASALIDDLLAR